MSNPTVNYDPMVLPFEQALALYPDFVQCMARERGVCTTTALWILGDEEQWKRVSALDDDRERYGWLKLVQANQILGGQDDLPGLLSEFQTKIGVPASEGSILKWQSTPQWERNWRGQKPQGRLICRGIDHPHMLVPLAIEVKPGFVFPAWTLTRNPCVRLAD